MENTKAKVIAALDSETTNYTARRAFPVCWQVAELKDWNKPAIEMENDNVRSETKVHFFRNSSDLFIYLDILCDTANGMDFVPVIMVHNLAFEMWGLSPWIKERNAKVVAKSTVKPLTITIMDDNNIPVLIFWDTLSFFGKSLSVLGDECGFPKLVGDWDYSLIRTPGTPLSENEKDYAVQDVYVLWAYLGYYLRLNSEIPESELAVRVITKTSAVRYKSLLRVGGLKLEGSRRKVSSVWRIHNREQKPKDNYEFELMHSAARGGFTYCAANHAGKVFANEKGMHVLKYDANSMHIFHALAHQYPQDFRECDRKVLNKAFELVRSISADDILKDYRRPFPVAFHGIFKVKHLRLKGIFKRDGISPLSSSKFVRYAAIDEDNEGGSGFNQALIDLGIHDYTVRGRFLFGKLMGASSAILVLNELSAWELCTCFDFDSCEAVADGHITLRFTNPTDKSMLSFNEFYKAKDSFKKARGKYFACSELQDSDFLDSVPEYLKQGMIAHDWNLRDTVEAYYMHVKSDLNSLYGIEATNEGKNEIILSPDGLEVADYIGVDALPDNPKAWFQYGMRIVGYSRIHQLLFMHCIGKNSSAYICGDTDSHKIYTELDEGSINDLLKPLHDACDKAMGANTERARLFGRWYEMPGLGHYECEGSPEAFSAAWNKTYMQLENGRCRITMAGVPCSHGSHSYDDIAQYIFEKHGFAEAAHTLIGYNVAIDSSVTGMNQRTFPDSWGEWFDEDVEDYQGNVFHVHEPYMIHLAPMVKVIGDLSVHENLRNSRKALRNDPDVNIGNVFVSWKSEDDEPDFFRF